MREIVQEDPLGCGVACTASVLSISYKQAIELFPDGKKRVENEGFYCRDIIQALSKNGFHYSYKYLRVGIKNYEVNSIVYLRRSRHYPAGHFLARGENGWMDPWINFPNFPRLAGFRKRLPGKPIYIIFQNP
jgi:hypothetical protein